MTTSAVGARAARRNLRLTNAQRAATFIAVLVAATLAAYSGLSFLGGSKSTFVLPLAVGVGLGLAFLAFTSIGLYIQVMLIVRSSLDLAKLSGRTAGNTAVAASQRAFDPSSLLAVLFLVAGIVWLAAQYRRQGRLPGSVLRRALVLFWLAGTAGVAASGDVTQSATESLRILAIVVMFSVIEQLMRDPEQMRRILRAAFLSLVFPIIFTTIGFLTLHPRTEAKGTFNRIVGTFNQSNDFGRYLMLMIVMGIAIYPHLERRWRHALLLMLGLSGCFLYLTQTRSALVGTVIGVAIVGWYQNRRILVALLVLGLLFIPITLLSSSRLSDVNQSTKAQAQNSGNSLIWRFKYWEEVLPLANRNPITGIGLNQTQTFTDQAKQPHNDFVRAYVETGIIGFAAYLFVLYAMVSTGRRAMRRSRKETFDYSVGVGFLGCAWAFIAVSAVANVISNVVNLWYLVAFAAAAASVANRLHLEPVRDQAPNPPLPVGAP